MDSTYLVTPKELHAARGEVLGGDGVGVSAHVHDVHKKSVDVERVNETGGTTHNMRPAGDEIMRN